jgi:hypothetical protein
VKVAAAAVVESGQVPGSIAALTAAAVAGTVKLSSSQGQGRDSTMLQAAEMTVMLLSRVVTLIAVKGSRWPWCMK